MILLDTNILIDYFQSRESALAARIDSLPVALCGPVRAEILHGALNEEEIDSYLHAFKTFESLPTDDYDWEGAGFVLQTLRTKGVRIPLSDALIAFTAMKYDIPLWTRDHHFEFVQAYYPELKLYK